MATLYVDFENGNDNYAGTSFALLASGTNGRINSTTFSSTGASFPNDGSLIGQYLSIYNGALYAVYNITAWVSSTSLTIAQISGGTALANQTVDRQYYIGGRWKSIASGPTSVRLLPGDTIRVMGSPAPTSLGQTATWTSSGFQSVKVVSGATNATPIAISCTNHGYSTGDTVVITGVGGNTNANGTWEITVTGANTFTLDGSSGNATFTTNGVVRQRNNTRIMLTTPVTQNIASTGPGRSAWTAVPGGNVITSLDATSFKEHRNSDVITLQTTFTTGLAAYYTLPSTLDLSGYQQVSFWILQNLGVLGAAGSVDLRLCSDTAGVNAVNTISIPEIRALASWQPVTVDLGVNLGNNIQSIAFYVNTDNYNQTFTLNNIIACKASSAADSLTLNSLIGKNTANETFYGIQSINGRRVMLDADVASTPALNGGGNYVYGYYGTSETITTWKREAIRVTPASGNSTVLNALSKAGTAGNLITVSGGWDRTNMSTQTLESWFDGQNGRGEFISPSNYTDLSKISAVRFNTLLAPFARSSLSVSNCHANNNTGSGISMSHGSTQSDFNSASNLYACMNRFQGINFSCGFGSASNLYAISNGSHGICLGTTSKSIFTDLYSYNNVGHGIDATGIGQPGWVNTKISNSTAAFNGNSGFNAGAPTNSTLENCSSLNNLQASYQASSGGSLFLNNCYSSGSGWGGILTRGCTIYAKKSTFDDTIENYQGSGDIAFRNYRIQSENHDNTPGNHYIFTDSGLITADAVTRYTPSGYSWKLSPTSSTIRTSTYPLDFSLARVAVAANSLVTIKAWMRRDNSGLTMQLVCKGGQIAGVPNDVVSTVVATGAWEEETITFTPTEAGIVEITAEAWGGTTFNGWVDDLTITQA